MRDFVIHYTTMLYEIVKPPSNGCLPISHLLPQFGILAPQFGDFLAKLKDFAPKLPHQFGQIGWLERQKWVDKRVFHDRDACNPDLPSMKSPSVSTKNGMGEALLRFHSKVIFSKYLRRFLS